MCLVDQKGGEVADALHRVRVALPEHLQEKHAVIYGGERGATDGGKGIPSNIHFSVARVTHGEEWECDKWGKRNHEKKRIDFSHVGETGCDIWGKGGVHL